MKKTALKLAGAALAVPILLSGLALPASATVAPPGLVSQPAPGAFIPTLKSPVVKLAGTSLPKVAAPKPLSVEASGDAAAAGGGADSSGLTKAVRAKTVWLFGNARKKNAWLGAAKGTIKHNTFMNTVSKKYQKGYIVGVPGGSAFAIKTAIHNAYLAYGDAQGQYLGYPMTNEIKLKGGGSVQRFVSGDIHWTANGGAHHVVPWSTWDQHGGMTGRLGYPTSDWITDGTRGFHQDFKGGTIIATHTKVFGHMNMKVVFKKK